MKSFKEWYISNLRKENCDGFIESVKEYNACDIRDITHDTECEEKAYNAGASEAIKEMIQFCEWHDINDPWFQRMFQGSVIAALDYWKKEVK